ncbi:insect cuticle protein domain-containing protein [Phthorimaea operculella]|nr:insect cuticle protein domain-containing protein [Phthorimaea operculella]
MKLKVPEVLRSEYDISPEGAYSYNFETENGIFNSAIGELKQAKDEDGKPQTVVVVRGEYTYTDEEGKQHTVSYLADETGFHPQSADIPVAPARR